MAVQIERVTTPRQLRTWVRFPWTVYRHDPYWVPPLYHERLAFFDKRRHPFFAHAEADYFQARRQGRVVGTIAAVLNHHHNTVHGEKTAHFGAFEVLADPEAAAALLETAGSWARARGLDRLVGPVNLSTNDECGLLVEGFDSPPVMMMTYNPPAYADYIEAAGFQKAMDLWAWYSDVAAAVRDMPAKVLRVAEKARQRFGLQLRQLDLGDWPAEVARVRCIYNQAWSQNWGFVPMTDAEFHHLANQLKRILDPALALAVERDGEPVGFALSVPDVNQPLWRFHPGPHLPGSYAGGLYSLWHRYNTAAIRVLVLGVLAPYRGRGIDALLYYETARAALARGYRWAEASWILENNDMMNRSLALLGMRIYKTYRIYQKELSA